MTSEDATTRTLRHLREDVRLLAIAALEPERFTFDLHLMAMGLSSDDRPEAHLVVAILLRAAQGKEPRSWGPDAPRSCAASATRTTKARSGSTTRQPWGC